MLELVQDKVLSVENTTPVFIKIGGIEVSTFNIGHVVCHTYNEVRRDTARIIHKK